MQGLAKQFGIGTHIIAQLLTGPEYESIREQIHKTTIQAVRDRLHSASEEASAKWIAAMGPAALKGDHRPMKDLLLANRVIDPDKGTSPAVVIQIGVQAGSVSITPVPQKPLPPVSLPPGTPLQGVSPDTPPDVIEVLAPSEPSVQVQGPSTSGTGTGTGTE